MAYHIYHTQGLVLESFPSGEDNRVVKFYTKELGILFARIQSARKLSSKHRYHIQNYATGWYSFVRGKGGWRLVGSESVPLPCEFSDDQIKFLAYVKIINLFSRLSPEESKEKNEEGFFDDLLWGVRFLRETRLSRGEIKSFETLFALKILARHGYWKDEEVLPFQDYPVSEEILLKVGDVRRKLNTKIHRSLEYSHL